MEVSDALTTVSRYIVDRTKESFGINKDIKVIPNFVDVARFKPDQDGCDRSEFATPEEKILIHMSNYRPVKNTADVIKIFDAVNRRLPSKLILVGDGPDAPKILAMAKEMGLGERVIFLGGQDMVESVLCKADLFLLPSASEAFGLAALEAMACGVPVVGSIVGGLPELVTDGETGYLEPIGDVGAMARRSIEILTNNELHEKMSINARNITVEKFNTDKIVDEYRNFYQGVLENG